MLLSCERPRNHHLDEDTHISRETRSGQNELMERSAPPACISLICVDTYFEICPHEHQPKRYEADEQADWRESVFHSP